MWRDRWILAMKQAAFGGNLRRLGAPLAVWIGCLCLLPMAQACPSCKEALGANSGQVVQGFFWSILFMMSMPFVLLSSFTGYMYLLVRRARLEREAAQAAGVASSARSTVETRETIEV